MPEPQAWLLSEQTYWTEKVNEVTYFLQHSMASFIQTFSQFTFVFKIKLHRDNILF